MYSAMLTRRPTFIGSTQAHGDPGGVFVKGSAQVNRLQSKLGGGGGNALTGCGHGALGLLEKDPEGEWTGGWMGLCRGEIVDAEGVGASVLSFVGNGAGTGERKGPSL